VCGFGESIVRKDRTPVDRAIAELAGRQWGVVSLGQLQALGLGTRAVQQRAAAGRLVRVHRGVYAVGHGVLGSEGRYLAAVLACGPGAVLSHRSAAAHWGLLGTDQTRVDVTAPISRAGRPGIRLHRARSLDARDTTTHEAIPITTVPRTLLDLAATTRAEQLERAFAQALTLRIYDHTAITDVLARANGHRGKRRLAAATAREPKHTKSDWEDRMLALIRRTQLPEPLVNHTLIAPDHGSCTVDFSWPQHELVVETDSWRFHGNRAAYEQDRARDAALQAAGYRVVRFTWHTPDATIERRLRAMLAQRRGRAR
jgi:very-short-patch-repair endonuclease